MRTGIRLTDHCRLPGSGGCVLPLNGDVRLPEGRPKMTTEKEGSSP